MDNQSKRFLCDWWKTTDFGSFSAKVYFLPALSVTSVIAIYLLDRGGGYTAFLGDLSSKIPKCKVDLYTIVLIMITFFTLNFILSLRQLNLYPTRSNELMIFKRYINEEVDQKLLFESGYTKRRPRRAKAILYGILIPLGLLTLLIEAKGTISECLYATKQAESILFDFGWLCLVFFVVSLPPFLIFFYRLYFNEIFRLSEKN